MASNIDGQMSMFESIMLVFIIAFIIFAIVITTVDNRKYEIKLINDNHIYTVSKYDITRKITDTTGIVRVDINGKTYSSNQIEWSRIKE